MTSTLQSSTPRVAVLFQQLDPPVIDGVRKPKKPTGYRDSSADIGYVLRSSGVDVVTPADDPDVADDDAWSFPDTERGIEHALSRGATTLWVNTVLFNGHPLEQVMAEVAVVGQLPAMAHTFDDKWHTTRLFRDNHLPIVHAALVGTESDSHTEALAVETVDSGTLDALGFEFPVVVKPVRGRGSAGVVRVSSVGDLRSTITAMLNDRVTVDGVESPRFGNRVMIESYLPGDEITMTVMPPGRYSFNGRVDNRDQHWSLPAVERSGHDSGVIPYNGTVPVSHNSRVVDKVDDDLKAISDACAAAAELARARAPIRIDCRRHQSGRFHMFDLNVKPHMTGSGRPGREDQDSLSCLAARKLGWSYADLLTNMLGQAW